MYRNDEERIVNLLSEKFGIEIKPNKKDPPDCFVFQNNEKILLEITSIHDFYYHYDRIKEIKTMTYPILEYIEGLNKSYHSQIPSDILLFFNIECPIENFKKFKKELKRFLKEFIEDIKIDSQIIQKKYNNLEISLYNSKVRIWIFDRNKYDNTIAIAAGIGVKYENSETNLTNMIKLNINSAIMRKHERMNNLEGDKWLAIECRMVLANYELCKSSINEIEWFGCFSKVFLILGEDIIEINKH